MTVYPGMTPELLDVKEDPNATPISHDAYVNDWHWIA
jgi:hypothetical protein